MTDVQAGLKYLAHDADRHGNVRWYLRRPGMRKVRLPGAPGSAGFRSAYDAAMAGEVVAKRRKREQQKRLSTTKAETFVYFLGIEQKIKIGFSKNPVSRAAGLSTGIAGAYESLVIVRGSKNDERALHLRFARMRIAGEWFKRHPELQRLIARLAYDGGPIAALENLQETESVPHWPGLVPLQ